MARPATYNPKGEKIMGIAAMRAKIFNLPELAMRTGIPYRTLSSRLSGKGDFDKTSYAELAAILRTIAATNEDITDLMR